MLVSPTRMRTKYVMAQKVSIGCIIGTRPEVIKMAPLIKQLQQYPQFEVTVIATAQHRELLDDMFTAFQIKPDIDLNIMLPNQSLAKLTGALCEKLDNIITAKHYDIWLAQGDTTTTFVASLIAFYHKIRFGHVEAGLRSYNLHHPFPEELNRILVTQSATWNFAPTEIEKNNLLKEGISADKIFITGNTVIDALYWTLNNNKASGIELYPGKRMLLVTSHRRENFGAPLHNICLALLKLSQDFPDIVIVYPVHPNPNVQKTVKAVLQAQPNIHLLAPLQYPEFSQYMQAAYLILTDSGGIQEEAPALHKPVLILRNITERPAVITTGAGILVGTTVDTIYSQAAKLLTDANLYRNMADGPSPYGDGLAAQRIATIIAASMEHPLP